MIINCLWWKDYTRSFKYKNRQLSSFTYSFRTLTALYFSRKVYLKEKQVVQIIKINKIFSNKLERGIFCL